MNKRIPMAATAILLVILVAASAWSPVVAQSSDLFFSEYIEGSSNNKALEIYNGAGSAIDLSAGGYNVQMFFNGSSSAGLTLNLTGILAAGDVYVLAQSAADPVILAQADQTNGSGWFNGDDAVVLRRGSDVIDVIGQIGFDPGSEWGAGDTSTADNTLVRNPSICAGDPDGSNPFDPAIEWTGFAINTFGGLGAHTATCALPPGDAAPAVAAVTPAEGAVDVALSTNLTVTFSEAVNADASAFELLCGGVAQPLTSSGDGVNFVLDPIADLAQGQSCTLTVRAAAVADVDSVDPPDNMTADFTVSFTTLAADPCSLAFTPIPAIQGSGATAAITGSVTTQGVVVGDFEGPSPTLRGFYLQDPVGDGDPATSDGIFVFNGNNDSVSVGQVVRVTGAAGEFQDQTQISSVSSIIQCGAGAVNAVDVSLPAPNATFLERYEGMLVRFAQPLFVTEHFQLGRFGQVVVTSQQDRQRIPTDVAAPGVPAQAVAAANDLDRIIIDDALNNQNPDPILLARNGAPLSAGNTLRGGDFTSNTVGILTYTWAGNSASGNAYRLRPIGALNGAVNFEAGNLRPLTPAPVGGTLTIASFNVLNYFNTFDGLPDTVDNCTNGVGGMPTDCRGADEAVEFERQAAKTVSAVIGLNADVIGLIELENDGYGPVSAIQDLVNRVNTATAPGTYAFIDVDASTSQTNTLGTDAIKVALIYKPAKVTPVGQTAALNTVEFVNGGDSSPRNRPALAQAFQENATGARMVVVVNHLKSKGSACDTPDADDLQGECNVARTKAATLLKDWLATDPTNAGNADILIIGDLNSYAMEDPITVLRQAGFTDLLKQFGGNNAYSYVFDGEWGYLDHALASPTLLPRVSGVTEWHINADEPNVLDYNTNFKSVGQIAGLYSSDAFRTSDHDPLLVGMCLAPVLDVRVSPDSLWPPNHKYVKVSATIATGTAVDVSVVVTSNEPDNGLGDGDKPNDIQIISPTEINLRAERAGGGQGRIYTLTYRAVSACGAESFATAKVLVPANQGNGKRSGDDGVSDQAGLDALFMLERIFLPAVSR